MSSLGMTIPGNVYFTGTVVSPQFVSNQQVLAPVAAGTASTLTMGSFLGTFSSVTNASFASTLTATTGRLGSLTFGSFMGINNVTPAFPLDVTGNINFTGSLYRGGSPYVSSQWTSTGTNLYFSSGNVGINTTNPAYSLDVTGSSHLTGSLTLDGSGPVINISAGNPGDMIVKAYGNAMDRYGFGQYLSGGNASSKLFTSGAISNALVALSVAGTGSSAAGTFLDVLVARQVSPGAGLLGTVGVVGINNTSPAFSLDVTGNINFTGSLYKGGSPYIGSQWTTSGTNLYFNTGNVGINTTSPSYSLDVGGTGRFLGTLSVTPVSADVSAINNDALTEVVIGEDMSGTSLATGTLGGTAVYGTTTYSVGTNCVQLTPNANNSSGSVTWLNSNPGNAWTASFESYVGGGSGADLISFNVYGPNGYSITFDEYANNTGSGSTPQFSIAWNGTTLITVPGSQNGGTNNIPLTVWNSIRIVFTRNMFRVYMNSVLVLSYRDTVLRQITGPNTQSLWISGFCGAVNNYHAVRNVRIIRGNHHWAYSSQASSNIYFPGGNVGINTTTPAYPLDLIGQGRMTSNAAGQLTLKNTSTANVVDACEVYFDRSSGTSTAISAVGVGAGGRGAYWWVNNADRININASGQVGINTASPAYTLDVAGAARIMNGLTGSLTGNNNFVSINPVPTGTNSILSFGSISTTGCLNIVSPVAAAGNWSTDAVAGDSVMRQNTGSLRLYAGTGAGAANLVINQSGFIGLNTANPAYTLDVSGSSRITGGLWMNNQIQNQMLCLYTNDGAPALTATNFYGFGVNPSALRYNVPSNSAHVFYQNTTEYMRLHTNGCLGINNNSPGYTLDVFGSARVQVPASVGTLAVYTQNVGLTGVYFSDSNKGIAYSGGNYSSAQYFANSVPSDGPAVFGWVDGVLGTKASGNKVSVFWNSNGQVSINNSAPAYNMDITGCCGVRGALNASNVHAGTCNGTLSNSSGVHLAPQYGTALAVYGGINWQGSVYGYQQGGLYYQAWNSNTNFQGNPTASGNTIGYNGGTLSYAVNFYSTYQGPVFPGNVNQTSYGYSTELFTGYLYIPYSETLTFNLQINGGDNCSWYLNDIQYSVAYNIGTAGAPQGSLVTITQPPVGMVPIRIEYIASGGGHGMALFWNGSLTTGGSWQYVAGPSLYISQATPCMNVGSNVSMSGNATGTFIVGSSGTIPGANGVAQFYNVANARAGISCYVGATNTQNHVEFFSPQNTSGYIGCISSNGASTSFNTSSDYRLKHDVQPLNASHVLEKLRPVTFDFRDGSGRRAGFLAHEVQQLIRDAVTGDKDAVSAEGEPIYQSMDYSRVVPYLTAAVQDLLNENKRLSEKCKRIDRLESLVDSLLSGSRASCRSDERT